MNSAVENRLPPKSIINVVAILKIVLHGSNLSLILGAEPCMLRG